MKNTINLILFLLTMGWITSIKAQTEQKGKFITDVYYGILSIERVEMIDKIKQNEANSELTTIGFGTMGVRAEYMLGDKLGLVLEGNFQTTTVSYNHIIIDYYQQQHIDQYKKQQVIFRIIPRINFYLTKSEKINTYFIVGAGYQKNYEKTESMLGVTYTDNFASATPRLGFGFRYFFTPHLGLNLEIGLGGGSITNGGVSFRF